MSAEMSYIYKITNTINGKAYIGQTTVGVTERWYQHRACAKRLIAHDASYKYNKSINGSILYKAMRKYGVDAFTVETLETKTCTKAELDLLEIQYVAAHGTFGDRGYNATIGGDGTFKHGEDAKMRMRETKRKNVVRHEILESYNFPFYTSYGNVRGLETVRVVNSPQCASRTFRVDKYDDMDDLRDDLITYMRGCGATDDDMFGAGSGPVRAISTAEEIEQITAKLKAIIEAEQKAAIEAIEAAKSSADVVEILDVPVEVCGLNEIIVFTDDTVDDPTDEPIVFVDDSGTAPDVAPVDYAVDIPANETVTYAVETPVEEPLETPAVTPVDVLAMKSSVPARKIADDEPILRVDPRDFIGKITLTQSLLAYHHAPNGQPLFPPMSDEEQSARLKSRQERLDKIIWDMNYGVQPTPVMRICGSYTCDDDCEYCESRRVMDLDDIMISMGMDPYAKPKKQRAERGRGDGNRGNRDRGRGNRGRGRGDNNRDGNRTRGRGRGRNDRDDDRNDIPIPGGIRDRFHGNFYADFVRDCVNGTVKGGLFR